MSLEALFGSASSAAQALDASGRWAAWSALEPALAAAGSAAGAVEVAWDRARPGPANDVLAALVRIGSIDGGVDESAVGFVCALLTPGAAKLTRSLRSFGPEVADVVAAQLWLQVREHPWAARPRAVAANVLMETRRAVLTEFGAGPGPVLVAVSDARLEAVLARAGSPAGGAGDAELLEVLAWARRWRVLDAPAAALLWELVTVAADEQLTQRRLGSSADRACERLGAITGVSSKTVRRRRDEAVYRLRVSIAGGEVPRSRVSR